MSRWRSRSRDRDRRDGMDRGRRDDRSRDYHDDRGRPDARDWCVAVTHTCSTGIVFGSLTMR